MALNPSDKFCPNFFKIVSKHADYMKNTKIAVRNGHNTILNLSDADHKGLFLEAWHSQREQNAGNEHIDIPAIYKSHT